MACQIELTYNPYTQAAHLSINGKEFERKDSKIARCLIDHPMSDWLNEKTESYLQWRGFLPEMISETNEISMKLVFTGTADDFAIFSAAVQEQTKGLSGYETIEVTLFHNDKFSSKELNENILRLIEELKAAKVTLPTQKMYSQKDRLDDRVNSDLTLEEARTLIKDYCTFLNDVIKNLEKEEDKKRIRQQREKWTLLLEQGV